MIVLLLLVILILPYAVLCVADAAIFQGKIGNQRRGRISLALLFCLTGIAHFTKTNEMILFLPAWILARAQIIYFTGILELAAAMGLLIGRFSRITGICLILFLICVFPANIYGAMNRVDIAGHGMGPSFLWIRAPLQVILIIWTYYFAVAPRR